MMAPLVLEASDRLLLLAPHPDDETLAAGGLLQRARAAGAELRVLFVTDGENNPWAQRAAERRWRIGAAERARWGERRRNEALAALAALGVAPWEVGFLGFPDQGLERLLLEGDRGLVAGLAGEIETFRPTLLAAPALEDLHPDHSALGAMTDLALTRLDPRIPQPREALFVVHAHHTRGQPGPDLQLALTEAERERKRQAILCHASQLVMRRGALLAFAGPEEHFGGTVRPAEDHPGHPVRRARVRGDGLQLELVRRVRPGACGSTDLLLLIERADAAAIASGRAPWQALGGRLPDRPGTVALHDLATGALTARGEVARAAGLGRGRGLRVTLPASLLGGATHAFLKLERRFGFFDEAGWRALVCAGRPAGASVAAGVAVGLEAAAPVSGGDGVEG